MGEAAAQAIIDERQRNGLYKSIFDFAERVNLSAVNRKAFESLALSGGFDSFGIKREQYFGVNTKGDVFLDTLVRYGQLYQAEQAEARNSLFGGADAIEIATPPVPAADAWSAIEKLNRERDLVGIYISGHPLDDYRIVLGSMCNTHCRELGDKMELLKKGHVTVGGIVTGVRHGFTKKNQAFGIVSIEDFDGPGELALFGDEWGRFNSMFIEGCSVYIEANLSQKYQGSNYVDFNIARVTYLQDVKEKNLRSLTINLDPTALTEDTVQNLMTIINDNPGSTELYFSVRQADGRGAFRLRARSKDINIVNDLVMFLDDEPSLSYAVNE